MTDIKWVKLSITMFDDEKIKLIRSMPEGDSIIIVWIQLISLAGKTNDDGMIYIARNLAYSDEMLATIFNHPLSTLRLALKTLEHFQMVEINPQGVITIVNWEKHQNIEGMDKIRQLNAERNKRYRERKKQTELPEPKNKRDVSVTSRDGTDIDIDKEKDNTSNHDSIFADFEKLWSLYPKKTLKKDALAAYKKAIKEGATNKQIQTGIVAYKKNLVANEWLKPMDGGRWFQKQRWLDDYAVDNTSAHSHLETMKGDDEDFAEYRRVQELAARDRAESN